MLHLGTWLRRLRQQHGETLAVEAAATGLSVSFLSDLERGRTMPSLGTLERLARHWQMRVYEIVALAEEAS